jgi:hypothetical protein
MTLRCGRGIHDGGFRLYPGSGYCPTHGTGSNTDTRVAAYPFHLPSVRQGIDIQDAMLFSKPHRGLDGRPIPFETLQIKISLTRKWGKALARHGNTFMVGAVGMFACHNVPGMRLSVQQQPRGLMGLCVRSMISRAHTASENRPPALTAEVGHSHRRAAGNADSTPLPRDSHRDQRNSPHSHPSPSPQQV